jgi:uncharacterized protein YdaU (DUF1376 family)
MRKYPYMALYVNDWLGDSWLSLCDPATRGIWIDLLAIMHQSGRTGKITASVKKLSRLCRCTPEEMQTALEDLSVTKTADVTVSNNDVTVVNRRMYREHRERVLGRERVRKHRSKLHQKQECNAPVTANIKLNQVKLSKEGAKTNVSREDSSLSQIDLLLFKQQFPDIDVSLELQKFRDYVKANGKVYSDYPAAFRRWLSQPWVAKSSNGNPQKTRLYMCRNCGGTAEKSITETKMEQCPICTDDIWILEDANFILSEMRFPLPIGAE